MGIDKDFVIRNGIEVNEDLLYADAVTDRVGIGTSVPECKLDVVGNICGSTKISAGTTIYTTDLAVSGYATVTENLDVGIGGTVLSVNVIDKKVGVNSAIPFYTHEIIGPVSTGTTAGYIYGDLLVTGDITATNLNGQITAGGTVVFNDVTVTNSLDSNDSKLYTLFDVETVGQEFNFVLDGDPPGIGFTQATKNPELYLLRGKRYEFRANTGGFPFYIKKEPTANLNDLFDNGVFNNGAQVGIVTFEVPYNAPNVLYYQASNVQGMGGTIYLNNDYKSINVAFATVSQYLDASEANFDFLNVTGFGTIANISDANADFTVSAGIVTAVKFVGVSTGSDMVSIHQKNDNVAYQVTFTDKIPNATGLGSNYQLLHTDTDDLDLTYNPLNKTLTARNFAGIATGGERVKVRKDSSNNNFQVQFSDNSATGYELVRIDSDSNQLTYNPSSNTLNVQNINVTKFTGDIFADNNTSKILENGTDGTDATFTGQASNATNVNILNDESTNAGHFVNFTNTSSGNQRIQADSQFKYNPNTGHLTVPEVFAFLQGTADKSNSSKVDERNNNQNYQVGFTTANGTGYQRHYIDSDDTHFTYNPATGRLIAPIFRGNGNELTNIRVTNIVGNNSTEVINIDLIQDATLLVQGVVQLSNAINGTRQNIAATEKAVGDLKIHANNASNLSNGTVNNDRLLKASLTGQGIVSLSDSIEGTSQTIAASERAVGLLNAHAGNASNLTEGLVNINLIQDASTTVQGVVQLSNAINGTSQTIAASEKAVGDLKNYVDTTPINPDLLPKASYTLQGITDYTQTFNVDDDNSALTGRGANNLRKHAANATNLTSGTVNNDRLNKASLTLQGIVSLSPSINGTNATVAASEKAVGDLKIHAANATNLTSGTVDNARLNKASDTRQGITFLNNNYPPDSSKGVGETYSARVIKKIFDLAVNSFPTGTTMLFYQSSAPVGWTQQTGGAFGNATVRVVNQKTGGVTGGSLAFTTTFAQRSVPLKEHEHNGKTGDQSANHVHDAGTKDGGGNHRHSVQDPGHAHNVNAARVERESRSGEGDVEAFDKKLTTSRDSTGISLSNADSQHNHKIQVGGNNSNHTHSFTTNSRGESSANMNFDIKYIAMILCTKDAG
jgi:hypothetical protein